MNSFIRSVILFLASWGTVVIAHADPSVLTGSLSTSIFSQYVGKIGAVFYEKPILVNDFSFSKGDCLVGVWNSTALGGGQYGATYGDETDFYAGWGRMFGVIRVDFTGAYYAVKNLTHSNDDLWATDVQVSFPKCMFFQPYVDIRAFDSIGSRSFEGGWFCWVGLRKSQETWVRFHGRKVVTDIDLMAAYSDGALHRTPGLVFGKLTWDVCIPITSQAAIVPSVLCQIPIGGQQDHPLSYTTRREIVTGLTIVTKF